MFKFLSEALIVVVVEEVTQVEITLVLVGYDSRVDKFQKVKKMFPHIYPVELHQRVYVSNFLKDIVPSTNDRDSYFLNLSDGCQCSVIRTSITTMMCS